MDGVALALPATGVNGKLGVDFGVAKLLRAGERFGLVERGHICLARGSRWSAMNKSML